ncbi:hypothetical protein HDU96_004462 [Phlyctochytrium bullatum]|nr:hypothetical protein HDU96_004462 [Phlyctochytrium bullatum]
MGAVGSKVGFGILAACLVVVGIAAAILTCGAAAPALAAGMAAWTAKGVITFLAASAAAGAVTGAGMAGMQAVISTPPRKHVDGRKFGLAMGHGAVSGAISGLVCAPLGAWASASVSTVAGGVAATVGMAAVGSATGVVSQMAVNGITGRPATENLGAAAVSGAISGAVSFMSAKVVGNGTGWKHVMKKSSVEVISGGVSGGMSGAAAAAVDGGDAVNGLWIGAAYGAGVGIVTAGVGAVGYKYRNKINNFTQLRTKKRMGKILPSEAGSAAPTEPNSLHPELHMERHVGNHFEAQFERAQKMGGAKFAVVKESSTFHNEKLASQAVSDLLGNATAAFDDRALLFQHNQQQVVDFETQINTLTANADTLQQDQPQGWKQAVMDIKKDIKSLQMQQKQLIRSSYANIVVSAEASGPSQSGYGHSVSNDGKFKPAVKHACGVFKRTCPLPSKEDFMAQTFNRDHFKLLTAFPKSGIEDNSSPGAIRSIGYLRSIAQPHAVSEITSGQIAEHVGINNRRNKNFNLHLKLELSGYLTLELSPLPRAFDFFPTPSYRNRPGTPLLISHPVTLIGKVCVSELFRMAIDKGWDPFLDRMLLGYRLLEEQHYELFEKACKTGRVELAMRILRRLGQHHG